MTPQNLVETVDNLFSLPEIYYRIKQTVDDPTSTIDDVAEIVMEDPNITARLLHLANSAFFGIATQIESVQRAISIMGLAHLNNLVLAISVTKAFKGINSQLVNMKDFWIHSVYTASLAKIIARHCNVLDSERLFVCGMLHDIGHLVIYTALPTHAENVLERASVEQVPLRFLEKEMLGFDYAEVGGALLQFWKLPDSISMPVLHHTQVDIDSDFAMDIAIVHLSNVMALNDPYKKCPYAAPPFDDNALQLLNIDPEQLEIMKSEARNTMSDLVKMFFSAA